MCVLLLYLVNITYFSVRFCEAIINGIDAKPGEFPFVVSLRNDSGLHYCGGALLSTRKHIITSAHCLYTDRSMILANVEEMHRPESVAVLLGTIHADPDTIDPENLYRVEKLHQHPDYNVLNDESMINDIGIITLKEKVSLPSAGVIELYDCGISDEINATVVGWGVYQREMIPNWVTSPVLHKLQTKVINSTECVNNLRNDVEYDLIGYAKTPVMNSSLICTVNSIDSGVCYRDSGSPLIINGKLAGITSFAIPCARNYPDFYTPIAKYMDFIQSVVLLDK